MSNARILADLMGTSTTVPTSKLPTIPSSKLSLVSSDLPSDSTIQVKHFSSTTSGAGNGTPSMSNGLELFSKSFTPKSSSSKIIIFTSQVSMAETSNVGDWGWILAGYDTTIIGYNTSSCRYSSFTSGLNAANVMLNVSCDSWGTSAKTIKIRAGMNGSSAGRVNYNGDYDAPTSQRELGLTIMEVAG
jgi:hypothetical protein